jgi:hypothetical protein
MPRITYVPTTHQNSSSFPEDSTSYAVWGIAWDGRGISSNDKSIVPLVRMFYKEDISLAGTRRRYTDNATLPTLPTSISDSLAVLRGIPQSRRVLFPNFLQDDGIGGNDLDNSSYYKNNTNTNVQISGVNWDSVFQYNASSSQTLDAKKYFKAYIEEAEKTNAQFSNIVDDYESWSAWSLGGVRLTGGTVAAWQTAGDARLIGIITADARFTDNAHGDLTRSKSWSKILTDTYFNLTGTVATVSTIMANWIGRTTSTDYVSGSPYNVPNSYYSWDKTMRQVAETHRVEHIYKQVFTKPWFTGKYSNYDTLNNTYKEWKYLRDYNTHYGLLGGLCHRDPKVVPSPVQYGVLAALYTWGYVTTPTTDVDLYSFKAPGSGVTAYNNNTYMVFTMDMQNIRSIIRENANGFRPWVRHPLDTSDACQYAYDSRYWNEMIYHSALSGANPFLYFQSAKTDTAPLHACLKEIKGISKNGTFKSCSNANSSSLEISDRIKLKDNYEKGCVSGGEIQSGQLRGQKLWRVTVPPHLVNGSGVTTVTLQVNGVNETQTVSATTRGFWYLNDTAPVIITTTG